MTTDIKSRLSGIGKQLKEKTNADKAAEDAAKASPAESAVINEMSPPGEDGAGTQREPSPSDAAGKAFSDEESPEGSSRGPGHPDSAAPRQTDEENSRISDENLGKILASFGWSVPEDSQSSDLPHSAGTVIPAPALEELAAEVTSAMEAFVGESVSVYEDEAPISGTEGEIPGHSVPQTTAVFPAIGSGENEEKDAVPPETGEEITDTAAMQTGERPTAMQAEAVSEIEPDAAHMDAKELFSGMNQEILKEVFSEEELHELEGDATHVFKKEELEDLNGKQKEAEEQNRRRDIPERRRNKRAESKPTTKTPEKKPAEKQRVPAAPPEPVYTARDYRPVRRKRSYRTGLRGGLMYFGFVVCVSIILASVGWLAADDVLSLSKDYVEAEVYVGEKLDMKQVSAELYNKGLIKYPKLFRVFAKLMKAETKMDPGVYTLSSKLDYNAMVHAMHQSESSIEERATVKVMIPEGKTLKQTFQILAEHGVCPYETLLECAANYEFKYDFLEELPYGSDTRLEGYLFPDTYEFYAPSDPEEAIGKFLSNFNAKVTAEMRLQASEMGYSLHEIVTVASLVEMEAGKDSERPTISSVIYNRLSSSYYPYLQIDAAIQYALEERKESLTNEDLEIDSPYNTYKYTGLPPGPIANPGLASIRAALEPESTGYYFYALNKSGSHNFFATMDQFEYFVNSSEFGG